MRTRFLVTPVLLAIASLSLAALPANAATARASNEISIFATPHTYGQILGKLSSNEEVTLDRSTADGKWCRVLHSGPTGWVPASYLIGALAKVEATPGRSITDPPFDQDSDTGHFHHTRN